MKPTVFLCQPSGLTVTQRQISEKWRASIRALGFSVRQLRRRSYLADPWLGMMRYLALSDGVLVLGFRQLAVHDGEWRGGTAEATNVTAIWTSPWLHAEAGMALVSRLPVLVAPESGVSEGVFASDTWTDQLSGTTAESPDDLVLKRWAVGVEAHHKRRSHGAPAQEYSRHNSPIGAAECLSTYDRR